MDARKFIYTSDYDLPLFVWKAEGGVQNPVIGTLTTYKFEHGLDFTPLIVGQWDRNSDFNTTHDIGYSGMTDIGGCTAYADATYIYLRYWLIGSGGLYYRLWAFAPSDYDKDLTPISDGSRFIFSTSFNYLQLYKEGTASPSAAPGPVISHNLGYTPLVRVWKYNQINVDGSTLTLLCSAVSTVRSSGFTKEAIVDSSNLYIGEVLNDTVAHYHIYTNEG